MQREPAVVDLVVDSAAIRRALTLVAAERDHNDETREAVVKEAFATTQDAVSTLIAIADALVVMVEEAAAARDVEDEAMFERLSSILFRTYATSVPGGL